MIQDFCVPCVFKTCRWEFNLCKDCFQASFKIQTCFQKFSTGSKSNPESHWNWINMLHWVFRSQEAWNLKTKYLLLIVTIAFKNIFKLQAPSKQSRKYKKGCIPKLSLKYYYHCLQRKTWILSAATLSVLFAIEKYDILVAKSNCYL